MLDPDERELAEQVIAAGHAIRRLHQQAEPLTDVRPDPLADAYASKALQDEQDGEWLLRNGIRDGYMALFRAAAHEQTARFLRRQRLD